MFRFLLYKAIMVLSLFWGQEAYADCRLSFQGLATNQFLLVNAETIHTDSMSKYVNFIVENTGNSDCYYFVTIDEGGSGDISYQRQAKITHSLPSVFQQANSDFITYQLYSQMVTESDIIKKLDHAVFWQNVLGPRHIRAGQTISESFLLHVPAQTLPTLIAESYADDLMLSLYQNADSSIDLVNDCPTCVEVRQQPLNIQFAMTDYVTLSIGNSYNLKKKQAIIDFGELETNKEQSFEMYVGGRSGSGSTCSVTIRSEHGSKLVRKDIVGKPQKNHEVHYTVHAQSEMGSPIVASQIDLSTPNKPVMLATSSEPFLCGNNSQGMMGIDVYITIGDVDKQISGVYRDTLIVEVTIGL